MRRLCLLGLLLLPLAAGDVRGQDKSPSNGTARGKLRPDAVPGYTIQKIQGFTVLLSDEVLKNQETSALERKPLDVLDLELKTITTLMPERDVNRLRNLLIWVEWDEHERPRNGREGMPVAVYYGGHQLHLLAKGKHPLKAKNITILSMQAITEEHQPARDSGRCVILHEMAHAVHDQLLGSDNPQIKLAYRQAMERKLYEPTMYASTNDHEFFAEMSCAYFDQLSYFPRTRSQLQQHDPATYKLMASVWGKGKPVAKASPANKADPNVKLDRLEMGQLVLGPRHTAGDLKGHVVLVVFWNANSPSSLACLPKLNALDDRLADFGLVTLAVHLTGRQAGDALGTARARNVSIAVREGRWVGDLWVKSFNDFPHAVLFDPTGDCVFRGSAFEAEAAVRAAVGQALAAGPEGDKPPRALAPLLESLRAGKSPTPLVPQVVSLTRSADAETKEAAERLLTRLTERGRQALQEARALAKEDALAAYRKVERLPRVFKDTPVAAEASGVLETLLRDKALATELRAQKELTPIRELDAKLGGQPRPAPYLKQLQDRVAKLKKTWPNTRAAEEAVRIAEKYDLSVP